MNWFMFSLLWRITWHGLAALVIFVKRGREWAVLVMSNICCPRLPSVRLIIVNSNLISSRSSPPRPVTTEFKRNPPGSRQSRPDTATIMASSPSHSPTHCTARVHTEDHNYGDFNDQLIVHSSFLCSLIEIETNSTQYTIWCNDASNLNEFRVLNNIHLCLKVIKGQVTDIWDFGRSYKLNIQFEILFCDSSSCRSVFFYILHIISGVNVTSS